MKQHYLKSLNYKRLKFFKVTIIRFFFSFYLFFSYIVAQLNKEQEVQIQKQQQEHFDQQLKTVRESITNMFQNDLDSEKKKRINLQAELEEKEKNLEAQEKKFQELISEHKQDLARNDEMNKIELKKSGMLKNNE